ncbi:MAG: histidine phosphatase family protein [Chloroflexota bacterium]
MKTLIILRHGKAVDVLVSGDKRRELTERGLRDAEAMGRLIGSEVGVPDQIVSSDAKRARQTAEIAGEAAGYNGEVTYEPEIYDATVDTLIGVVRSLPDSADYVILVGHNPGFESLSADLAPDGTEPPRLPTSGFAHLQFNATSWRNVRPGTGTLLAVHWPKE